MLGVDLDDRCSPLSSKESQAVRLVRQVQYWFNSILPEDNWKQLPVRVTIVGYLINVLPFLIILD